MITEGQILPYQPAELFAGPWLVLAPHADDETFGMGGSISKAVDAGLAVRVLVMTDGAQGGEGDNLVAIRQQEARQAAALLGVSEINFLGEPDRGLQVNLEVAKRLCQYLEGAAPATVFFPSLFEPHPDHRATALLAWQAVQTLPQVQRPLAVAYEISVQSQINTLIDITGQIDHKRRVMELYLSQVGENNYIELVVAMNKLRTFTLAQQISFAEGFCQFSSEDLSLSLAEVMQQKIAALAET